MSELYKYDALFVGAHRDDVEITCGGTVRKLVEFGYKVAILDLTKGEKGSRGNAAIRKKEAECAARMLGVAKRINLGLPDAFVENTRENRFKAVRILRDLRPKLLILPYFKQRHPDHRKAPELLYDACHLSGLVKVKTGNLKPHRPLKIMYTTSFIDVKPSIIIDITDQLEIKLKAVACYDSQFEVDPNKTMVYPPAEDIFDFIKLDARRYGYKVGKTYAEPFVIREPILIDDPVKLEVPSI
ncbi:MAG: bacillithiol biosynthesis deacetylase BshB1 [candidate division Zixibacteria bacterium]|nr:bacillithiol biosynthesis deacetylase BshB1 [candidate division Zixibacteria bacterium]